MPIRNGKTKTSITFLSLTNPSPKREKTFARFFGFPVLLLRNGFSDTVYETRFILFEANTCQMVAFSCVGHFEGTSEVVRC